MADDLLYLSEMTNFVSMLYSLLHRALVCGAVAVAAWLMAGCINDDNLDAEQTTLVGVGQVAPDFTVEMLDGQRIRLQDLRGGVVLLTFWDPECPSCRSLMAATPSRIVERMERAGVEYIPISRGYSRAVIADFCQSNGYTFPVGLDPDKSIYTLYATKFVPRSFLIDKKGVVRSLYVEYELDQLDEILSAAERLAEE